MTSRILDGAALARALRAEAAAGAARLASRGVVPGLTVVLVGEDAASSTYVRNKEIAAREAGFAGRTLRFPATLPEAELLATIDALNRDDAVDGILVQLPLPKHVAAARILEAIDPRKDADGFHPENAGRLLQGKPAPVPCTPAGILELLRREDVPLRGARAVVLGPERHRRQAHGAPPPPERRDRDGRPLEDDGTSRPSAARRTSSSPRSGGRAS